MAFQLMKKSSSEKESELVALREQLDEVMRVYKQEQMDRQLSEEGHGEVVRELQKMLSEDRGVRTEVEKEVGCSWELKLLGNLCWVLFVTCDSVWKHSTCQDMNPAWLINFVLGVLWTCSYLLFNVHTYVCTCIIILLK